LLLSSGSFSRGLLNLIARREVVFGEAVRIEEDLEAIGSLRGEPKYKSWMEDFA